MSKPLGSLSEGGEKSLGEHLHRRKNLSANKVESRRRIIFPILHPKSEDAVKYYGSQVRRQQQQKQQRAASASEHAIKEFAQDNRVHSPKPELERSLSFPKNGLKEDLHQNERRQMLPLPKLPDLKPKPPSPVNAKRGLRIRDSICVRKAILPKIQLSDTDDEHRSMPISNKKWVIQSQSPQIDSLYLEKPSTNNLGSHRTYYPAASIPTYHDPPSKTDQFAKQPLPSILRTNSTESLGHISKRRSSILFRKSSTIPTSPDYDFTSSTNERLSSSLTLASPTSIRSLTSELDNGEPHRESIGETESDLNRITIPRPQKVIPRRDNKLRRNASDTVVAKSEEEVQQRRRKSIHLEDTKILLEDGVTRHESLECLPSHKKISFDPHIWVYEFTDDRHEFEHNGGKWFTEDELDQFKEEAIQRIRQRNMKMMSAGQGRIAMVPPAQDRSQSSSPLPTFPADNSRQVVFTHPALGCEDEVDHDTSFRPIKKPNESLIQDALAREIRNVLVVDPHEIFLTLFTKCFKYIIPHVSVATARSGEEALSRYDVTFLVRMCHLILVCGSHATLYWCFH